MYVWWGWGEKGGGTKGGGIKVCVLDGGAGTKVGGTDKNGWNESVYVYVCVWGGRLKVGRTGKIAWN